MSRFFNAVKSVAKTIANVATKFISRIAPKVVTTIFALTLIIAIGATIALLLPVIVAGTITSDTNQEETQPIALIPPKKPSQKRKQEIIENEVIITPPSDEYLLLHSFLEESIKESPEVLETLEPQIQQSTNPLNNQLATIIICWQAIAKVSIILDKIKASELKSIASDLQIPRYRNMNKSQLMISIIKAQEEAPEFSQ
jgi:hypothetical protein